MIPVFVVPALVTTASNPDVVILAAASPNTDVPGTVVYAVVRTTGASVYATSNFTAFDVGVLGSGVIVTFPHWINKPFEKCTLPVRFPCITGSLVTNSSPPFALVTFTLASKTRFCVLLKYRHMPCDRAESQHPIEVTEVPLPPYSLQLCGYYSRYYVSF